MTGIPVVAVFDAERRQVAQLAEGQGFLVLERTPFYLESGGQVSDSGAITNEASGAVAEGAGLVRLTTGGPRAHRVTVTRGSFKPRDIVTASVNDEVRDATRRNHTATHLLHAALRQVLGSHVRQAGSLVAPDRLRFDFSHMQAVTREELDRIASHISQAREMIGKGGPVGRRLDFLAQEFNREVNTCCSKSNDLELTNTGLEMKNVVEQFREQVQNLE